MKNKIFVILGILALLCGCGKNEENNDTIVCEDSSLKAIIELNGENVLTITAVAEFETSELTDSMCMLMKTTVKNGSVIKCEEKKVTITDYQESIELESNTKEDAIKYFEDKGYTCK